MQVLILLEGEIKEKFLKFKQKTGMKANSDSARFLLSKALETQ